MYQFRGLSTHTQRCMSLSLDHLCRCQLWKTTFTIVLSCLVQNCCITHSPPVKPPRTEAVRVFSTEMLERNEIQCCQRVCLLALVLLSLKLPALSSFLCGGKIAQTTYTEV